MVYKIKSFSLYAECRWNGFSETEELGKQLSFAIMYINFFFDKSNFMRTNPLILAKQKLRTKLRTMPGMLNIRAKILGQPFLKL